MLPQGTWWARVAVAEGAEYRLATSHGPMVWHDFAYRTLAGDAQLAEEIEGRSYRAAAFIDGELDGSSFCTGRRLRRCNGARAALTCEDLADGAVWSLQITGARTVLG